VELLTLLITGKNLSPGKSVLRWESETKKKTLLEEKERRREKDLTGHAGRLGRATSTGKVEKDFSRGKGFWESRERSTAHNASHIYSIKGVKGRKGIF